MSELPPGWAMSTAGDVGEVSLGRQRAPKYHRGDGMRPYLRVANVFEDRIDTTDVMQMHFSDEEFDRYRLQLGDVLLNEGQSPHLLGRPAIYRGDPPDVAFTNSLIRFRTGPAVTPEWALVVFRHHLRSKRFMRESRITTNIAHLSATRFSTVEFPIPPMSEQKRIVAAIEEQFPRLDAGLAALERVQENLRRMRAAVLQQTVVPAQNRAWPEVTINDTITIIDYRGRTPPFSNSGIPHLRSFNIKSGRVAWEGCTYVSAPTYERYMSRGFPAPGDLLFTTEAPMGEVAPAPVNQRFCIAQRMMLLKPDPGLWASNYLMYHLQSPWFQAKLRLSATGTTVRGISSRNFRPLTLLLPPLNDQHFMESEIGQQLSIIEAAEDVLRLQHSRVNALRSSILAAAFSGTLVPQDPTDEPALAMLERIAGQQPWGNGDKSTIKRTRRTRTTG